MESDSNNQTPSEAPNPAHLDEFDRSIQFISSLKTEKAMKDLAKMPYIPNSIKDLVETMALSKMDIVKSLKMMDARERALKLQVARQKANQTADEAIRKYIADNPDYEITMIKK